MDQLNQSFQDFELLVCNDGSTDNTVGIVKKMMKKDSRISLINNSNGKGLPAALNFGMTFCTGKYIARMDDDDISLPNRLAEQYLFLEKHSDISLVGSNVNIFDKSGIYGTRGLSEFPSKYDVWKGSMFVHPSVMFRKKNMEEIGGYEASDDTLRIEDYDCWCRLYAHGYVGVNIQKPLLNYREDAQAFKKRDVSQKVRLVKCMHKWRSILNIPLYYSVFQVLEISKILVPEQFIRLYHRVKYGSNKKSLNGKTE